MLVLVMRLGIGVRRWEIECRVYIARGGGACCVCGERLQDKTEESSRVGVESGSKSESAWASDPQILSSGLLLPLFFSSIYLCYL